MSWSCFLFSKIYRYDLHGNVLHINDSFKNCKKGIPSMGISPMNQMSYKYHESHENTNHID